MVTQDLDNPAAITQLVDAFYHRVLTDPTLAPVFLEVARIDLAEHKPRIEAFWRMMLLGRIADYNRNMVARHVAVHARFPFQRRHFDRWLTLFTGTVDAYFAGPGAERAKTLALRIATNLERNLDTCMAAHG